MIEMLITDLDGTLADRLLRLAGPDSLRHRLFVVDGDESEQHVKALLAILEGKICVSSFAFSGSRMDDIRVLLVWSSSSCVLGITL
ncbi:hypothetical protein N7455_010418 [Penicillium solitum]|uniref:uncharacterized protein n=1 Tax=Penicillium solitum TaxID=60172 RepID=UPI0032C421FB|nr:hypothetical protein N7455_010418 [Penicillium solitum]